MNIELKKYYTEELAVAANFEALRDYSAAFKHLERAHILSQRFTFAHTATHLRMLRLSWRTHDTREAFGQITRTAAALLFSKIWVPVGNTGRANVSALKPMPIPDDLADVLKKANSR